MTNDLWGASLPTTNEPSSPRGRRKAAGNPLIAVYGAGPDGAQCGTCLHFMVMRYHDYRYFKCELRGVTHGPGTDMRKKWPACGRYQAKGGDA